MFLPPQSRRVDVRKTNAQTLEDISSLYGVLISKWLSDLDAPGAKPGPTSSPGPSTPAEEPSGAAGDDLSSTLSFSDWTLIYRSRLVTVSAKLKALQVATEDAKWEGSVRGEWPYDKYARLLALQSAMLGNLAQLLNSLAALDPEWRRTLLQRTPVLNPNLVSTISFRVG